MNYAFKISMYRLEGQMPSRFVGGHVLFQIIYSNHVLFHSLENKITKTYAIQSADIKRDGIQINRPSYTFPPNFARFLNHLL